MATVRSTATHTYSTEDCLGLGATCEVFKGISKSGEVRALKVFGLRADRDLGREIKALKQLDHRNVIKYYGCEEEIGTRRLVVITEFCDGGSLLDYLNKPENTYGLDEDEFLLLLKHILAGMKHYRERGLIHRDIKPANILRCITEDGGSLYKFSDFGTAKPLEVDEKFQSLVGTEEYLHPDIYKAAFLERQGNREFSHTVDLWSLGATLYHSASGRVPFRPHHGRADKQTMFMMIGKKPPGVIAGMQTGHRGEIKWSDELPSTSPLSLSLKKRLASMIANLMENNPDKMWTFEDFFQESEDLLMKEVLVVLTPTSIVNPFLRLYLNATSSISDMKKEVERQTKIPVNEQQLYLEDVKLSETVNNTDQVQGLQRTSQEEPIILLPGRSKQNTTREPDLVLCEMEETPIKFTANPDEIDMDYRQAKRVQEQMALIYRQCHLMSLTQRHFIGIRRRLRRKQADREENVKAKNDYVSELFAHVSDLANSFFSGPGTGMWPANMSKSISKIESQLKVCGKSLEESYPVSEDVSLEHYAWCFENSSCKRKFSRWLDRAKDIVPHFNDRRKKRNISRLDERVHVLEKSELKKIHLHAREHWGTHCISKNKFLQDSFYQWATNYYATEDRLKTAEKTLEDIQTSLANLSRQISESRGSLSRSIDRSDSVRQKSLSIDEGVRDELKKTQEMKAIVIDFRASICEIFEDLEDPMELDMPEDIKELSCQ